MQDITLEEWNEMHTLYNNIKDKGHILPFCPDHNAKFLEMMHISLLKSDS